VFFLAGQRITWVDCLTVLRLVRLVALVRVAFMVHRRESACGSWRGGRWPVRLTQDSGNSRGILCLKV
jgi:hypothetical protein